MADDTSCDHDQEKFYIGVDVGTASVRAGLFNARGRLMGHAKHDIHIWINENIKEGSYEQSSEDIWQAVCHVVKCLIKGVDSSLVCGIGFDATCSLVAIDTDGCPVTVSPSHDSQRNIILWKDHRAILEADEINKSGHPVLNLVGGAISPEMEPPKLLWLKRNLPNECWGRACHFFDLADYLVYRCTGVPTRSLCTLVCKWTYIGHSVPKSCPYSHGWNDSFWRNMGLGDLVDEGYTRIGTDVKCPGEAAGSGLLAIPASQLGLVKGTAVAISLIDAHAGGLGMLGASVPADFCLSHIPPLSSRLAIIAGTSSCHMATSLHPLEVKGVWGPYYSAMVPDYYLNEGGQSAAGSLIDHILKMNESVFEKLESQAKSRGHSVYTELDHTLSDIARKRSLSHLQLLTRDMHITPDFHGNRSPLADPTLRGMISGLSLDNSLEHVAILYLATIQSLACGSRHIMESMSTASHQFSVIFVCGGLGNNPLYLQTHSDVTGLHVLLPEGAESVLLGSAILARSAASNITVKDAMNEMSAETKVLSFSPTQNDDVVRHHQQKYCVYREMLADQLKYRNLMNY